MSFQESNPGVNTFASDQITGVNYPKQKLAFGVDGTATDVSPTNPLPVTGGGGSQVKYNTTQPILTDGQTTIPQSDINGDALVREVAAPQYEDNVAQVAKVEHRYNYGNVSTAATTLVKNAPGFVHEIRVLGGTLGNVTVYDSLTATGLVIVPIVTPIQGGVLIKDVSFTIGLTIVTAAATVLVISYR